MALRLHASRAPDMTRATWNGQTIAESTETVLVEGNHYFPPEAVNFDLLRRSETKSSCGWKGDARYYTIVVDETVNEDAAWYYPVPKTEAENIKGHVAFWKGVSIEE